MCLMACGSGREKSDDYVICSEHWESLNSPQSSVSLPNVLLDYSVFYDDMFIQGNNTFIDLQRKHNIKTELD